MAESLGFLGIETSKMKHKHLLVSYLADLARSPSLDVLRLFAVYIIAPIGFSPQSILTSWEARQPTRVSQKIIDLYRPLCYTKSRVHHADSWTEHFHDETES